MKKLFFLVALMSALAFSVSAYVPGTSCVAIYQVPTGEPYNTRIVRPPFFETNRWECVYSGINLTAFPESPQDPNEEVFHLAIPFGSTYYPILYVDTDLLNVYAVGNGVSQVDPSQYTVEQGTGVVTFNDPPGNVGDAIEFEITPESARQSIGINILSKLRLMAGRKATRGISSY